MTGPYSTPAGTPDNVYHDYYAHSTPAAEPQPQIYQEMRPMNEYTNQANPHGYHAAQQYRPSHFEYPPPHAQPQHASHLYFGSAPGYHPNQMMNPQYNAPTHPPNPMGAGDFLAAFTPDDQNAAPVDPNLQELATYIVESPQNDENAPAMMPSEATIDVKKKRETKKSKNEDKIKRPMNAFIVWSQEQRKKIQQQNPYMHNANISRILGEQWKAMSAAEKKTFVDAAQKIKQAHMRDHPGYKYCPNRKNGKKKEEKKETSKLGMDLNQNPQMGVWQNSVHKNVDASQSHAFTNYPGGHGIIAGAGPPFSHSHPMNESKENCYSSFPNGSSTF